jgi:hypothetical protein
LQEGAFAVLLGGDGIARSLLLVMLQHQRKLGAVFC